MKITFFKVLQFPFNIGQIYLFFDNGKVISQKDMLLHL